MLKIIFMMLLILINTPAVAEYYEYTDSDGSIRYTDDPSRITNDQVVTIHESIETDFQDTEIDQEEAAEGQPAEDKDASSAATEPGAFNKERAELQTMQENLRKTHADLEAQRAAIGPQPTMSDGAEAKKEYNDKIQELNEKISEYDNLRKEFDEKIKAYNTQVGKK